MTNSFVRTDSLSHLFRNCFLFNNTKMLKRVKFERWLQPWELFCGVLYSLHGPVFSSDDWSGSDTPWRLLLQGPVEHPRLHRRGGSFDGLRPYVSLMICFNYSHGPIIHLNMRVSTDFTFQSGVLCFTTSSLLHWLQCKHLFHFVYGIITVDIHVPLSSFSLCGWCLCGNDQQQCDGVKAKNVFLCI